MKIHPLITTTDALADLCERLAKADFVCVDTEFMRENTYWPELCLIQVASPTHEAVIDPLADDIDLEPLLAVMRDERILKVFHAARQDIEIVWHRAGIVPHPVFDTQVAAMALGQGEQIGYSNLVDT
jgi:ribonuclease D